MDDMRFVNFGPDPTASQAHIPRPRPIQSCAACRRRKVRCDRRLPACSACERGNHSCVYSNPTASTSDRVVTSKAPSLATSGQAGINARLDRLEALLERAIGIPQTPNPSADSGIIQARGASSASSNAISSDGDNGTLLLEGGQSYFVSSLHWALLADEIQDIRALLSGSNVDITNTQATTGRGINLGIPQAASIVFAPGRHDLNLASLLPESANDCLKMLAVFFSNVDPMTRLVHKPTLTRRFSCFVKAVRPNPQQLENEKLDENLQTFEPLAFAVLYAATISMQDHTVIEEYAIDKESLSQRFRRGVELSLEREKFLTTSSIEVLQAFVLFLSCRFKEDDLGESWPLTGLAIRIARAQGLHREPLFFRTAKMDAIQVELRRRLWHQLCHLDFRGAEARGQEPTISDVDFTTLLPQNIDDEALLDGANPSTNLPNLAGFTDMTAHLIRLSGYHCFRKVVQSTYQLECLDKTSGFGSGSNVNIVAKLHALYEDVRTMVDEMLEKQRTLYLKYCDPSIPLHKIALRFVPLLEWKCWVLFWLRIPKRYREAVFSSEVRTIILNKSVMLLESLATAHRHKDAEPFRWHISGHSAFQAIMHILSELITPEFCAAHQAALRNKALSALQVTRDIKANQTSQTWEVVRRQIDKIIPPGFSTPFNLEADAFDPMFPSTSFDNSGLISTDTSEAPQITTSTNVGTQPRSSVSTALASDQETTAVADMNDQDLLGTGLEMDMMDLAGYNFQDLPESLNWGDWNIDATRWSPSTPCLDKDN